MRKALIFPKLGCEDDMMTHLYFLPCFHVFIQLGHKSVLAPNFSTTALLPTLVYYFVPICLF
jgi:hypothetical protein